MCGHVRFFLTNTEVIRSIGLFHVEKALISSFVI